MDVFIHAHLIYMNMPAERWQRLEGAAYMALRGCPHLGNPKLEHQLEGYNLMTRIAKENRNGNTAKKQPTASPFKPTKWLTVDIRAKEHQARITERLADERTTLDYLVSLVDIGHDFSFKRDARTGRPTCYAFLPDNPNDGMRLAVSAYGQDAYAALVSVIYKLELYSADDQKDAFQDENTLFG